MPAHGADRHGAQQALFPARVACNPTAMTDIRPITPDSLAAAGKALREGRLVAFPTETVYGLGGNAENDCAVAAIFAAKDRPRFNPLIVHVPDLAAARRYGAPPERSEERRVGKEGGSTCRFRWYA